MEAVIIIVLVEILALAVYAVAQTKKDKAYNKISFRDTLEKVNLPIITFYNNNTKLNFILDTGANRSIIHEEELQHCTYGIVEVSNSLTGLDGTERQVKNVLLPLICQDIEYSDVFQATDISQLINGIYEETGVQVSGIIGNSFFDKYKYVLDFDELAFYSKKRV